jgi:hypothetical protein
MDVADMPVDVEESDPEEQTQERNMNKAEFEDFNLDLNGDPENHHTPESLRPLGDTSQLGLFEDDSE